MPKRTNPTSLRIGVHYPWSFQIQNYNFKNISRNLRFFLKVLNLPFLLKKSSQENLGYLNYGDIKLTATQSQFTLILYPTTSLVVTQRILPTLFQKELKSTINLYHISSYYYSVNLILQHVSFLFLDRKLPLKKVVSLVSLALQTNFGFQKLVITKFGPKLVVFRGFKLELSGRYESTTNQMAKKLKQSFGILPLTTLDYYIEYTSIPLFFKLGSCTLKVWLIYF